MKKYFKLHFIIEWAVWLIISIILYFIEVHGIPFENSLIAFLAIVLPIVPPVYLHFFLINRFFLKKKYLLYGLGTIITLIIFGFICHYLGNEILSISYPSIIDGQEITIQSEYDSFFAPLIIMILFTAIRFSVKGLQNKIHIKNLEAAKNKAELSMLKTQINPHFLFNSLNTLFSMANTHEDYKTAEGLAKLSHLMRYMLYETNSDEVLLKNELEHIDNFIKLNVLRFENTLNNTINIDIEEGLDYIKLPPLLLIPFIENAFKHGLSVKNPFFLNMQLGLQGNRLVFTVENPVNPYKQEKDNQGIGLENIRKRLDLLYHGNFTLDIKKDDNTFFVGLEIPVKIKHNKE